MYNDFTNQYNTQLTPEDESAFQSWAAQSNRLKDLYDYDLRGWWKQNGQMDQRGHMTDQFKKPNHPTFSDQSQYHGQSGLEGGQWSQNPDGSWGFLPGKTNMQMFTPEDLQDYFNKVEKGNVLTLPQER